MNIRLWIDAQIDIIKNCVSILDEKRENPDYVIIQLWALKKHIDAMVDFLEMHKNLVNQE